MVIIPAANKEKQVFYHLPVAMFDLRLLSFVFSFLFLPLSALILEHQYQWISQSVQFILPLQVSANLTWFPESHSLLLRGRCQHVPKSSTVPCVPLCGPCQSVCAALTLPTCFMLEFRVVFGAGGHSLSLDPRVDTDTATDSRWLPGPRYRMGRAVSRGAQMCHHSAQSAFS